MADGGSHRLPDERALHCEKLVYRKAVKRHRYPSVNAVVSAQRTVAQLFANTSIRMLRCGAPVSWPSRCWRSNNGIRFVHP